MRRNKLGIVVGYDADGKPHDLYCGTDYTEALAVYDKPPEGIRFVEFYRTPAAFRHRETEESVLIDQARQEEAERRSAEQRAAAEAQEKAIAEAKAAEEKARIAKLQAEHAAAEKTIHAAKLAEEAETLERIATAARAKADLAAGATGTPIQLNPPATNVTQAAAAPGGTEAGGAPSGTTDPSQLATAATSVATELAPGEIIEPEALIGADQPEAAAPATEEPRRTTRRTRR